jgi:hypothetical protein
VTKQEVEERGWTLVSEEEAGLDEHDESTSRSPSQSADDVNRGLALTSEIDPRRCEHFSRDGRRCKGWKVRGSSYCAGHSGLGVAASPKAAAAAARQSAVVRQEKAQVAKRRAVDVYREAVEEHAEAFVRARLVIINDPTAPAGDRLRAMEQLESRALGKPKETVEHQDGKSEVDEALDRMSTEELEAIARQGRELRAVNESNEDTV